MRVNYLLVCLLLIGCSPKVTSENLKWLHGYWVIAKAEAPNGEIRPYTGTMEVDFFELKDSNGIRKKLKPLFGNQFNKTNDAIGFTVSFQEKSCILTYSRQKHSWQEEVVRLRENELQLKDARGVVFHYKRYVP